MTSARIEKIKEVLLTKGYAALAINAGPTMTYLTGLHFHLMERPVVLIISPGNDPALVLPELEMAKLTGLSYPVTSYGYPENPEKWGKVFTSALAGQKLSGGKLAVEPNQLRLMEYQYLQTGCPAAQLVDGTSVTSALRSIKDENEIAAMKKAVEIAERALEKTLGVVAVGVSEADIAGELFLQLIRSGSETSLPFMPIVAAGPNSANPHAQPSSRKLQSGDLLVIDWGASYGGYASDLTRTFGIERVGETEREIHRLVHEANRAGRQAGRPGVPCGDVDDAARACIAKGGYGEYFTHRTGHGLGRECHEEPYIRSDSKQLLRKGNTYTIEPGIYLPGRNGVRIEDDVLITETGAVSLSTMNRSLKILG